MTVRAGRIASLSAKEAIPLVADLGDVAILPGLINAHTHLEFSDLAAPLGEPGMPLPGWIRRVIEYRRTGAQDALHAITTGLNESVAGGATALGEIATGAWDLPPEAPPIHVTAFHESIALAPERIAESLATAGAFLDSKGGAPHAIAGLSPHAPYTVHPELCRQIVELAIERDAPVAMHVAESMEELELLREGRGALIELFRELGFWREGVIPRGARPLDTLRELSRAPRALVIHGNYLDDDELEFLAQHAERMALVYCPRTHAYFGHRGYHALNRLLRRGVRVCLGTDSRASNPDLSIWTELQFVAARNRDLSGEELLSLATTAAAHSLGLPEQCGQLSVGASADFCVARLAAPSAIDPYDLLWDENAQIVATVAAGKLLHCDPGFANFAT